MPQTGDHRVYAKWPALPGNATTAVYTVTHQGGATPVVVNQRVNGGQWVLLGSFPFEASGSGYKVELADNGLGTVAADAIHVVKETVATDGFAWTPVIPSTGSYDLYARWTASSANSSAASYTVVHGAGTDVVPVNQKQNGGQWVLLGNYGFEPDAGHQVTLTAAADGAVVADAIRLVGTGPAPADIIYVHADQLGTPQKLTDATQAIVWDRVQDPFGRQVSLTAGTGIANPLRFPGQLFDGETGFHYNYFRDYDPSTGRYIQSDPIGLGGGINTFAYVGGNPTAYLDPLGLFNPAKGLSALGNAAIAGFSGFTGAAKIATGAGLLPSSATGVGALPPVALLAWGTWNLKAALAAWDRARQQWGEALCEDWSQGSLRNFYGLLPGGTQYDDPGEATGPLDYINDQGWGKFLGELGYI